MPIEGDLIEVNKLSIWNHQKDAIREIATYFSEYSGKGFLVKMPTGTGKTGVFACLSRIVYPNSNYIIITPSKALKFQILDELKDAFWNKIKKDAAELPNQEIEDLMPNNINDTIEKIAGKNFILVTTIQALQIISSTAKHQKEIETLKKNVDYLIFDEGHKEPAYTWGETVRAFKKPTVLFSATPYRNDYKIFNIDKIKFYSLEHEFCEKNNILRSLEIRQLVVGGTVTSSTFVNALISQLDTIKPQLAKQGIAHPKVIIRCESQKEIESIVKALVSLKKRTIGIHENFTNKKNFSSNVPLLAEQDNYDFFIHQYKLIEGIDNPDFCVVAIYSDFASTRLLIQQIGRILRNPGNKPGQFAYLFSLTAKKIKDDWRKYLEYDQQMVSRKKLFDVTDVLKVNKDVNTLYFSGTFRDLINVNNIILSETLLFQKKINAFIHDNEQTFEKLSELLLDEWAKRDYSILKHEIVKNDDKSSFSLMVLYIIYQNSPLVKNGVFIEQKLALTYLNFQKDYIFFYDSEQNNPLFQHEALTPVSSELLTKLFSNKKNISRIFLHNTDIGKRNLRSKELFAGSVESTAPGLADHSYFPARMEGYVSDGGETKRRYVGFQFGRITDFSATRVEFKEFQNWIYEIKAQLNAVALPARISGFLNRFSNKVSPPTNPNPVSILLDIDSDLLDQYTFGKAKDQDLIFEDFSAVVTANSFELTINGSIFSFNVEYLTDRKRYIVTSIDFDDITNPIDPNDSTLLTKINTEQSFRIIVEGNQYVYAYRNFYKPGINLISKKKELDLKQLFHVFPSVSKIKSEKGSKSLPASKSGWHKDTLFGLIASNGIGYGDKKLESMFTFDYMVCDDLNSEIGDFIALDTVNKKVVFIHAKAGHSKLSASAFTEVCGQATKNLDYLTPYFQKSPTSNIKRWGAKWSIAGIGAVERMVKGSATPKAFWSKYITLISDPSVSREVWMFVGNMFDYNTFAKEINRHKIENVKPEVIQLVYLLRSTWDNVSSVGAQLKIFC